MCCVDPRVHGQAAESGVVETIVIIIGAKLGKSGVDLWKN
jgi:hypothetical protein